MNAAAAVLTALLLSQTLPEPQPPPPAASPSEVQTESAADAARRAADAAQRAAESAERSTRALEAFVKTQSAAASAPAAGEKAQEATGAAPDADAAKGAAWNGSAGISLISITGNAQTLTLSSTGTITRTTDAWVTSLRLGGAYGQTRAVAEGDYTVSALNALAQLRADRRFTQFIAAYAQVGADTDHVKSIEYRTLAEAGAAITWVERKEGDLVKLLVRSDLAFRHAYESRFQYYPEPLPLDDITLIAPKVGLGFRYALNEHLAFVEEAELLFNIAGDARVLVSSLTRLNARLTDQVALSVGFQLKHDSTPAEGRVPTDTTLSVGLETAF